MNGTESLDLDVLLQIGSWGLMIGFVGLMATVLRIILHLTEEPRR